MSRAFADWNVDQAILFPATTRDYLLEDHATHSWLRRRGTQQHGTSSATDAWKQATPLRAAMA